MKFLEGLAKHIKNKNQSQELLATLKNYNMLNVSLTKTEQNTLGSSIIYSSKPCRNKKTSES